MIIIIGNLMDAGKSVRVIEHFFNNPVTGDREVERTFKEVDTDLKVERASTVGASPLPGRVSKLESGDELAIQAISSAVISHHVEHQVSFDNEHLSALHGLVASSQSSRIQAIESRLMEHVSKAVQPHAENLVAQLSDPTSAQVGRFLKENTVGEGKFFVADPEHGPVSKHQIHNWLAQMAYRSGGQGYDLVKLEHAVKGLPPHPKPSLGIPFELTVRNRLTGLEEVYELAVSGDSLHRLVAIAGDPLVQIPDYSSENVDNAFIKKEMEALVTKLGEEEAFSGVVLHAQNGKVVFEQAVGMSNIEKRVKNSLDTSFNLASVGKIITAELIARLVADSSNEISYDTTIDKLLPQSLMAKFTNVTAEEWRGITVEDLLRHRSWFADNYHDDPIFEEKFGGKDASLLQLLDFVKEQKRADVPMSLQEDPNFHLYSNTNYLLLGAIIQEATDEDFRTLADKHVFSEMTGSGFLDYTKGNPKVAVGYKLTVGESSDDLALEPNTQAHVAIGGPDGGCAATARGMMQFCQSYLSRVGSADISKQAPGFGVEEEDGILAVGHLGAFDGVSTLVNIYPRTGDVFIVLSNVAAGRPIDCQAIERTFFGMLRHRK